MKLHSFPISFLFILFLTCCTSENKSNGADASDNDAVDDDAEDTAGDASRDILPPCDLSIDCRPAAVAIDEEIYACINGLFPAEESPGPFPDKQAMEEWFDARRTLHEGFQYEDLVRDYYAARDYRSELSFTPSEAYYWPEMQEYFSLGEEERSMLDRNGFVVTSAARTGHPMETYFNVFQGDLPVLITADSIFHAMHTSQDSILEAAEEHILTAWLAHILSTVHAKLPQAAAALEGSGDMAQDAFEDVDLFLTVSRDLLSVGPVASVTGAVDDRADEFVSLAEQTPPPSDPRLMDIFGSERKMDFSQFTARGHYADSDSLSRYFRAFMWVSRVDFRFWSLSYPFCPSVGEYCHEGHRQLAAAALLASAAEAAGMLDDWTRFNHLIETMVGERDSMCPDDLLQFMTDEGYSVEDMLDPAVYPEAIVKMEEAGLGHQRIASHILRGGLVSDGPTPLPISFTFFGQKFIVDSYVFSEVVWDRIEAFRAFPDPLDAMFVLGNPEALPLIEEEITQYRYAGKLADLRDAVSAYPDDFWQGTVYNAWLGAVRTLDADWAGDYYPESAKTLAWQHRMLQTQLASWAQLRHDFVLYVKQSYTGEYICSYPDGYVDPYPRFFEAVAAYAAALGEAFCGIELSMVPGINVETAEDVLTSVTRYAADVEITAWRLAELAGKELCGEPWCLEDIQFFNEALFGASLGGSHGSTRGGGPIPLDGWFVRLYWSMVEDEYLTAYEEDEEVFLPFEPVVTDVHTCPPSLVCPGGVLHVGTGHFDLMILAVQESLEDPCSVVYAGPVTSYYQFVEPGLVRLTDEEWKVDVVNAPPARPAWVESFLVD